MSAITAGRICVKTAGKDAAEYCVITDVIDDAFVEITGPKALTSIKRKRCNLVHLEPTADIVKIKAKATDEEILKAIDAAKLTDKMKAGLKL
ncbi:MAG: 50S ribosomal protein L14e [Candidatus Aenigmarchaeota archaeon]|nr:50S ribosomal protein L14e [Candidatus Aenigmarchaeota archaeon]